MSIANNSIEFGAIPQKKYFTISEVSSLCNVKSHVLRYWEQEFKQLCPAKRKGNRRYYQYGDVILVRTIYDCLYNKGFTISGARQYLSTENKVMSKSNVSKVNISKLNIISNVVIELEQLLLYLKN